MKDSLLIIGAGIYGVVVKEIAQSLGRFDKIAFVDDKAAVAPDGSLVIGTVNDMVSLSRDYTHVIVAIGNPKVRKMLLDRIEAECLLQLATLISPRAYISPSACLTSGCVVEPMAVVHAKCTLGKGCLICAGAVVNHGAICGDCVQIDCNATVAGNVIVPDGAKISSNTLYAG